MRPTCTSSFLPHTLREGEDEGGGKKERESKEETAQRRSENRPLERFEGGTRFSGRVSGGAMPFFAWSPKKEDKKGRRRKRRGRGRKYRATWRG